MIRALALAAALACTGHDADLQTNAPPPQCEVTSSYGTIRPCVDVCMARVGFAFGTCDAPAECWRVRAYDSVQVLRLAGTTGAPAYTYRDCQ